MANVRLIKRRIKSAQNIGKITRAMEMVAASKMKKSQEKALQGKPYAEKIFQAVRELGQKVEKSQHPLLLSGNPAGKILVVLISTNKGLCGGLNASLFRETYRWFGQEKEVDFISFGRKGRSFLLKTGKKVTADFSDQLPFSRNVPALISLCVDGFVKGEYREVYLVYSFFVNALRQIPFRKRILPIVLPEEKKEESEFLSEFVIEPSPGEVLESLLPHYLENQVRSALFEAEASEHSARMMAMKNATEAAADLVAELTLLYNKARQEKITYEIADMVTARKAVED